jgi:hypothetical protein
LAPKETSASVTIFFPTASSERDSVPVATSTLIVCLPFYGCKHSVRTALRS